MQRAFFHTGGPLRLLSRMRQETVRLSRTSNTLVRTFGYCVAMALAASSAQWVTGADVTLKTHRITFAADAPAAGGLVAPDGRLSPPGTRIRPDSSSLVPSGRWSPPAEVLRQVASGHYLELSDCDVRPGSLKPSPAPGAARATWKLVVDTGGIAAADGQMELELQFLAGPGRSTRSVIRWDGVEVKSFDSSSPTWQVRSERVGVPIGQASRHVLELTNANQANPTPGAYPKSLLLTSVGFSQEIQVVGQSVLLKSPNGSPILLATPVPTQPVRLWTLGHGGGASDEFLPGAAIRAGELAGMPKPLRDGYDAELRNIRFPIIRNPNGSQVDDFRGAVSGVTAPATGRFGQAVSFAVEFDSPVSGDASLVGRLAARGGWRVTCGDRVVTLPTQDMGPIAVGKLYVSEGKNRLVLESLASETRWDWLGLEFSDPKPFLAASSAEGWPLAPASPIAMVNKPLLVDPKVRLSFGKLYQVQPGLFGITAHNGIDALKDRPAVRDYFKACRFAAAKGADGILAAAPQKPLASAAEMTEFFNSKQPMQQYLSYFWNFGVLGIPKTAQGLELDWCMIGSGLPNWMLLPPASDWNLPPKDPALAAQAIVGSITTVRRVWPELKTMYVWNEPDAGWWRANDTVKQTFGVDYATYFRRYLNVLSKAVRSECPDMRIAAPSTLDVPLSSAALEAINDRWETWFEPLIRESWKDFDLFDFHFYGRDTCEVLANLEALAAAGTTLHGETKPVIITESNYSNSVAEANDEPRVAPEGWLGRALPYARFLVAMAGQPHRLQGNMCHDLLAGDYGVFVPGGYEPTPVAQVFRLLSPVRGSILGGDSLNPDLTWVATREGNQLTAAMVTSPENGGEITVAVPLADGVQFTVRQLCLNPDTGRVAERVLQAITLKGQLVLPAMPGSVITLQGEVPPDAPIKRETKISESFATGFVRPLDVRTPSMQWEVKGRIPTNDSHYRVRIAAIPADALNRIRVTWNGKPLAISGRFVGESELSPKEVLETNQIAISMVDPKSEPVAIIASASLITIEAPAEINEKAGPK